ncbi:MAG TPA: sugar MFS transporter [Bacteroidales bacterium]|nr:sugar MFS transporter [Bacteroidales bacterium]
MTHPTLTTREFRRAFLLVTSLFFLWGLAHGLVDTLNKHFQLILQMTKAQSGLIQFALYGAYFGMALPAGFFMRKFGYKKGILLGLGLFAAGAFLIAGTTVFASFWVFLPCLFLLGCGLATLETAANPYTIRLGPQETSERRINFAQSFNGLAWVVGPIIGLAIYGNQGVTPDEKLQSLILPYTLIGGAVMLVFYLIYRTPLPEIREEAARPAEDDRATAGTAHPPLFRRRHFVLGVLAQLAYVAAQTGVFSYLINFVTDEGQTPHFDVKYGPWFLSIGFALFMGGRMGSSYLMAVVKPAKLLALYALLCSAALLVISANLGWISLIALFAVFFFMSVMFPTIFALGIRDLGTDTQRGASFMVMSIVGGALFPMFMGWIADHYGMAAGFLAPLPLFLYIFYYALAGSRRETLDS